MYLLGQECQICFRIWSGRACAHPGEDPEPGLCEKAVWDRDRDKDSVWSFCEQAGMPGRIRTTEETCARSGKNQRKNIAGNNVCRYAHPKYEQECPWPDPMERTKIWPGHFFCLRTWNVTRKETEQTFEKVYTFYMSFVIMVEIKYPGYLIWG